MSRPKYVASCSFGKDSIAAILLAKEHDEPLDEAVYCEVMKKKALQFLKWCRGAVPSLAMLLAIQSVTSTCFFCLHQPNVPEGLNVTDKTPKI